MQETLEGICRATPAPLLELYGGAAGRNRVIAENRDAIAQRPRFVQLVCREQYRLTFLRDKFFANIVPQFNCVNRIEGLRRFVEDKNWWIAQQSSREIEALPHSGAVFLDSIC